MTTVVRNSTQEKLRIRGTIVYPGMSMKIEHGPLDLFDVHGAKGSVVVRVIDRKINLQNTGKLIGKTVGSKSAGIVISSIT